MAGSLHPFAQVVGHLPVHCPDMVLEPLLETVLNLDRQERQDLPPGIEVHRRLLELGNGLCELLVVEPMDQDAG